MGERDRLLYYCSFLPTTPGVTSPRIWHRFGSSFSNATAVSLLFLLRAAIRKQDFTWGLTVTNSLQDILSLTTWLYTSAVIWALIFNLQVLQPFTYSIKSLLVALWFLHIVLHGYWFVTFTYVNPFIQKDIHVSYLPFFCPWLWHSSCPLKVSASAIYSTVCGSTWTFCKVKHTHRQCVTIYKESYTKILLKKIKSWHKWKDTF